LLRSACRALRQCAAASLKIAVLGEVPIAARGVPSSGPAAMAILLGQAPCTGHFSPGQRRFHLVHGWRSRTKTLRRSGGRGYAVLSGPDDPHGPDPLRHLAPGAELRL